MVSLALIDFSFLNWNIVVTLISLLFLRRLRIDLSQDLILLLYADEGDAFLGTYIYGQTPKKCSETTKKLCNHLKHIPFLMTKKVRICKRKNKGYRYIFLSFCVLKTIKITYRLFEAGSNLLKPN